MNNNNVELLRKAKTLSEQLHENLPEKIDVTSIAKIPFKALSLREALIHRISEFSRVACHLFEGKDIVSAIVITRALFESVALNYSLYKKIAAVVKDKNVGKIDKFLMSALVGRRDDDTFPDPIQVLTSIDKLNKLVDGSRQMYDSLSEVSHPNWAGALGEYSSIDKGKLAVNFGSKKNEASLTIGLNALVASLEIYHPYYNEMADIFPEFIKICEGDLKEKNN